jgi:hypothetical protein
MNGLEMDVPDDIAAEYRKYCLPLSEIQSQDTTIPMEPFPPSGLLSSQEDPGAGSLGLQQNLVLARQ